MGGCAGRGPACLRAWVGVGNRPTDWCRKDRSKNGETNVGDRTMHLMTCVCCVHRHVLVEKICDDCGTAHYRVPSYQCLSSR